jgi:hypothetical protein
LLPVVERRLQLQDARRSGPRFFGPPEFRERRGQKHIRDAVDWIALDGRLGDVASGDLILVGGESCQDFGLLALGDLDEVQGPPLSAGLSDFGT